MIKYLEREFNNYGELRVWTKAGKIAEYKRLARMFDTNPTMEISSMMSDLAIELMTQFNMSAVEIETLELSAIA